MSAHENPLQEDCLLEIGCEELPAREQLPIRDAAIEQMTRLLNEAGLVTTVRKLRGDDIDAACGQLAGDVKDRTRVEKRIVLQRQADILLRADHKENRRA